MSAIGLKQTFLVAPLMSAFGGKADMTLRGNPLSRSLLGAKRTCSFALHMSANDPKRTLFASSCRREAACEGESSQCHLTIPTPPSWKPGASSVNSGALTELTETVDAMSDGGKRSWRNMFPMIVIEEGRTPTPKPEGRLTHRAGKNR